MKKEKKYGTNEYKVARIIICCFLLGLIIGYFACLITGMEPLSIFPALILAFAGGFLLALAIVIRMQKMKVELEYDDIVTYKLCGAAGVLLILAGIACLAFSIVL